eukprot:9243161-Ditylum_brightwellii.AAC.1
MAIRNHAARNTHHTNMLQCNMDIVGTLLYYLQAVDPTLAAALSTIVSQQANMTKETEAACHQLLDYVATHLNAAVQFL